MLLMLLPLLLLLLLYPIEWFEEQCKLRHVEIGPSYSSSLGHNLSQHTNESPNVSQDKQAKQIRHLILSRIKTLEANKIILSACSVDSPKLEPTDDANGTKPKIIGRQTIQLSASDLMDFDPNLGNVGWAHVRFVAIEPV